MPHLLVNFKGNRDSYGTSTPITTIVVEGSVSILRSLNYAVAVTEPVVQKMEPYASSGGLLLFHVTSVLQSATVLFCLVLLFCSTE